MNLSKVFISIEEIFPKLYEHLPGWIRGEYYVVTASTGVGKTKFTKYAFVEHSYKYCKKKNIPLKILYFALEESKEKFWDSIRLDILSERFKINMTYYQFHGYHSGWTEEATEKMKLIEPVIEDMQKVVTVIDYVSNPTGLYHTTKSVLGTVGTISNESSDAYGNNESSYEYKYNDPDQHVIVVVDHVSLISSEKRQGGTYMTQREAMSLWSEYVVRHLIKKYGCIVVNVHQQEMASENKEAFKMGKLEPSLETLGDNKTIGRDYTVAFGLFNPSKHGMAQYHVGSKTIDVKENGGKLFRTLHVMKHRNGTAGIIAPMKFGGASSKFTEV
jgi:replicative DNA helicase